MHPQRRLLPQSRLLLPRKESIFHRAWRSTRVALKMLLKHDAPEYPTEAIAAGIQGMVVLWAQIDVNGRVSDLKIVNGPSVFQKVAMDSARKWIYKPFLVDGKPVEVNTKIYLVFTMENHRASVYSSAP